MDCAVCKKPAKNKCSACKNVSYCSVACQKQDWKDHKTSCLPYVIKKEEDGTEYFEAIRDLKVGTIIFDETPIFQIPSHEMKCCLACSIPIRTSGLTQSCSKCRWPICSPACEKLPIHRDNECEYFSSNKLKCFHLENASMIASGIRGIMIKKKNKELWNYLQSLGIDGIEIELEEDDKDFGNLFIDFMKRMTAEKKDFADSSMMPRKLLVLANNKGFPRLLFQHGSNPNPTSGEPTNPNVPNRRGHYFYKKAGKMTHSCSPNTSWHIGDFPNFKFRLRTVVPIKKGEKLTLSRMDGELEEMFGTILRKEYLMKLYNLVCKCPRCSSPSEFETYLSAIKCETCFLEEKGKKLKISKENKSESVDEDDVNSGYFLPVDPTAFEKEGHPCLWKCNRCDKTAPYSEFDLKIKDITKKVDVLCDMEKNISLDSVKQFIKKYEGNFLHPHHYLLLRAYIQIFSYHSTHTFELIINSEFDDRTSPEYRKLVDDIEDGIRRYYILQNVVDKILPGFSNAKAFYLVSLAILTISKYLLPTKTGILFLKCEMLVDVKRMKEELEMAMDYYKTHLNSHRDKDKCDQYTYFKNYLDMLSSIERATVATVAGYAS